MEDPEFQKEMKQMTESEAFKKSMNHAKEATDELLNDPVKLKQLQSELEL